MFLKKRLKKYGNAVVIRFSPEELDVWNLGEGDVVKVSLEKTQNEKEINY